MSLPILDVFAGLAQPAGHSAGRAARARNCTWLPPKNLALTIRAAAGIVDLSFGPEQPADATGHWIQTIPGRGWFTYLRIYGPGEPAFNRTWKPGDLQAIE